MDHIGSSDNGDEFLCPVCGRRLIIQWPPEYKKTILIEGDNLAVHSAAIGISLSVTLPLQEFYEDVSKIVEDKWQSSSS